MSDLPEQLKPQPNDVRFTKYREPGDSGCLCSRCLMTIGENRAIVLYMAASGKFFWRYHASCLDSLEFDDNWYEDE